MAADMANKRPRKPNFSENEINVLIQEVKRRNNVLFGKPSPYNTPIKKIRAWEEVTLAVNAVASQSRSVNEIKNKWKQEKARTKLKQSNIQKERRKTGGGPAVTEQINDYEDQILSIIGTESISGINDAVDIGLPLASNHQDHVPIPIQPFFVPIDEIPFEIPGILPPPPNFATTITGTNISVGTQTDFHQQQQPNNIFEQNKKLLEQGEELNKNVASIATHLGDIKNYLCVISQHISNNK